MDFLVYLICFVIGILFTIISAAAGHLFGGVHHGDLGTGGHAEAGFDHTGMPGMSFFSPTVMASFVTAFGGFGMIFSKIRLTHPIWISAPLSALGALALAGLVFWGFNLMFEKTQGSSEARVANLAGQLASILTPIPLNGVGEIAYVCGGTRYTAPTRSERGEPVSAGQSVRITRVIGSQFWVEPVPISQPAQTPSPS